MKKIFTLFAALACVMSMSAVTYNVTVPAGTKACYIAGEMNSWGHTEMTKVDDTHFTLEVATATEAMKYKYCSGPDWKYVEKTANGADIDNRTYSANDVVEKWAAVYNPDIVVETKDIVYSVTVPEGTLACYIAGDMTSWGHKEMTRVDATHYTITLKAATDDAYKYCSGPDWKYVELNADDSDVQNRTYSENDVVAKWKEVYNEGGTINPQDVYYVTGNATLFKDNAWKSDAIAMTGADGVYTHTFTAVEAGVECQLKVTDGTWDASWGFSDLTTVPAGVTGNNDNNIIFTLAEAGDVVVTFSAEKITITGNFEASDTPVEVSYVLMGVNDDWSVGIAMTKNEGADNEEYMLLGQTISEGDSVKVVRLENGEAKHWCGNVKEGVTVTITPDDKMGNIILTPGAYDFYYDVAADAIWIAVSTQSAINNVAVENRAVKIIRNGQMFILHDGMMYNIVGQIAE